MTLISKHFLIHFYHACTCKNTIGMSKLDTISKYEALIQINMQHIVVGISDQQRLQMR